MTDEAPDTGTETTETVVAETTTTEGTPSADDLLKEVEKWKTQARKHEDRSKANANAAKELETLKQASMNDLEKAVDLARKEARSEVLREVGSERVEDAIRLTVNGRVADVDEFLKGVNLSRFLDDDGQPNREAIAEWVDTIVPKRDDEQPVFPDLGQGNRSAEPPGLGTDALTRDLTRLVTGR